MNLRSKGASRTSPDLTRFTGDTRLAQALLAQVNALVDRPLNLMEVCGTHTMAISSLGVRRSVDPRLRLISGPGCPVCVTDQADIDTVIDLSGRTGATTATFGDMMRVPGSQSSLEQEAARGRDIRVVYSPLDAVRMAQAYAPRPIVFLAVGFETTAPTIAAAVKVAARKRLKNFLVLPLLKTIPAALRTIAGAPQTRVDGFILPGHVSTIIGVKPYEFLACEFHKPCCIVGFELLDILQGILMLLRQVTRMSDLSDPSDLSDRFQLSTCNQYRRTVMPDGNPAARKLIAEVFQPCDAIWRGLGSIPGSGLEFRHRYQAFDARRRFDLPVPSRPGPKLRAGCRCGDVLLGAIAPPECKLFARVCTPENPVGPCMVSSEGACAAYYKYER
jgi:hydrogenase expression/formation protein HypD